MRKLLERHRETDRDVLRSAEETLSVLSNTVSAAKYVSARMGVSLCTCTPVFMSVCMCMCVCLISAFLLVSASVDFCALMSFVHVLLCVWFLSEGLHAFASMCFCVQVYPGGCLRMCACVLRCTYGSHGSVFVSHFCPLFDLSVSAAGATACTTTCWERWVGCRCVLILRPIILNEDGPVLLAAIKLVTKVLKKLSMEELESLLEHIVPGMIKVCVS